MSKRKYQGTSGLSPMIEEILLQQQVEKPTVVIEVVQGVAELVSGHDDVEVIIKDLDLLNGTASKSKVFNLILRESSNKYVPPEWSEYKHRK